MQKKIILFSLLIGLCFAISSCGSAIPEMTESQEQQITQYMADLLLEYDVNYQQAYLSEQEKAEAITKEAVNREKAEQIRLEEEALLENKREENTPEDVTVSENENSALGDMDSLGSYLDLIGIEIEYLGFETTNQYPKEDGEVYFTMTPTQGNEFVVLSFQISNITSYDYVVDIPSKEIIFSLTVNEELQSRALMTLFEKDLSIYSNTLSVESGDLVFLIFEKPVDVDIYDMVLETTSLKTNSHKKIPLMNEKSIY